MVKPEGAGRLATRLGLHAPLSKDEESALGSLMGRVLTLREGEVLAAKGDHLDLATLVIDGMLGRCKALPDGRRQILSLLLPGDLADAHASVLHARDDELFALCATQAVVIPQSRIAALEAAHPQLRESFLREAFLEGATAREWVLNVGRRNAYEALAHLICELHQRLAVVGLVKEGRFRFPLKQQHLADALGLSNIHLNRVFRQLRENGLIVLEARWLTIPDVDALRAAAHFDGDYLHLPAARAA